MTQKHAAHDWDERYADSETYVFGTQPSPSLVAYRDRLTPGMTAISVADGEGRNGVWLAECGLDVLTLDWSERGLAKARALATQRGVTLHTKCVDILTWDWPTAAFDVAAALNFHFPPAERDALFAKIKTSLKPGGLLIFEGLHTRNRDHHDPATLFDEARVATIMHGLTVETITICDDPDSGKTHISALGIKP
ncbi:MAG: class I SAM-dependent methyltransferase [Rhodospirillaceae bacterium]|nr:class I SAM-dependent methyltransferase [Rhodospirillaceae bacterium]